MSRYASGPALSGYDVKLGRNTLLMAQAGNRPQLDAPKLLAMIGPPGAGKTSVATSLATSLPGTVVSASGLLQEYPGHGINPDGTMADDTVVSDLVLGCAAAQNLNRKTVILDGFPRTLAQYVLMQSGLVAMGYRIEQLVMVFLDVPWDVADRRLRSRGRDIDDSDAVRFRRFGVYLRETAPILTKTNYNILCVRTHLFGSAGEVADSIRVSLK